MSAYGTTTLAPRQGPLLPATRWALRNGVSAIAVYHLTACTAPHGLADLLYGEFQAELERGGTYPQAYPITRTAFEGYFLASDVFVGVFVFEQQQRPAAAACAGEVREGDDGEGPLLPPPPQGGTIDDARDSRAWQDCFAGAYYVKPNYPGRSSHICNAGFLVPPRHRGIGIASALARSYVHYAPRLGFKASVFNLVYVNNVASVRIWERLGFEKIGRIPRAGKLRRQLQDGAADDAEEYVDAWVIWKSFESDE